MSALSVQDLCCGYGGRTVINVGSFEMGAGEATVVVGPNGSGKSTLLRTICGSLAAVSGSVKIGGRDLGQMGSAYRARAVAMLMQIQPLDPGLTVEELARLGRTPYLGRWGNLSRADFEAVDRALETCRLTEMRDRVLGKMSGGERQRARLAMVLAQETPIVLLDEPTSHLDIEHRYMLHGIVERARRERGVVAIMVSHALEDARRFGDASILVQGGKARLFSRGEHDALVDAIRHHSDVPVDWVY